MMRILQMLHPRKDYSIQTRTAIVILSFKAVGRAMKIVLPILFISAVRDAKALLMVLLSYELLLIRASLLCRNAYTVAVSILVKGHIGIT